MGYESKIYFVRKSTIKYENRVYAETIAMIDLSKAGELSDCFRIPTNCYIYGDDGNTHIVEDMYGEPLREGNISEVIEFLENVPDDYWRFKILLYMCKAFEQYKDITLLHYGY